MPVPARTPEIPAEVQTDLAGQAAVKLAVKQEGWYRVSQRDLVNAGFSAKVDPRNLQLYVDGRPVPMIVNGAQDGGFDSTDSVEFYGVGINSAVTDSHVYWLAAGSQPGTRITPAQGASQAPAAKSFQFSIERGIGRFICRFEEWRPEIFGPGPVDGPLLDSTDLTTLDVAARVGTA